MDSKIHLHYHLHKALKGTHTSSLTNTCALKCTFILSLTQYKVTVFSDHLIWGLNTEMVKYIQMYISFITYTESYVAIITSNNWPFYHDMHKCTLCTSLSSHQMYVSLSVTLLTLSCLQVFLMTEMDCLTRSNAPRTTTRRGRTSASRWWCYSSHSEYSDLLFTQWVQWLTLHSVNTVAYSSLNEYSGLLFTQWVQWLTLHSVSTVAYSSLSEYSGLLFTQWVQ